MGFKLLPTTSVLKNIPIINCNTLTNGGSGGDFDQWASCLAEKLFSKRLGVEKYRINHETKCKYDHDIITNIFSSL
jgi:hypothetical protein